MVRPDGSTGHHGDSSGVVAATTFRARSAAAATNHGLEQCRSGAVFSDRKMDPAAHLHELEHSPHPPPRVPGHRRVSADGINGMGILLGTMPRLASSWAQHRGTAHGARGRQGIRRSNARDAAIAFEDIAFDTLLRRVDRERRQICRAVPDARRKCGTSRVGTVLVSSSIEHADAPTSGPAVHDRGAIRKAGRAVPAANYARHVASAATGRSWPHRCLISVITDDSPD